MQVGRSTGVNHFQNLRESSFPSENSCATVEGFAAHEMSSRQFAGGGEEAKSILNVSKEKISKMLDGVVKNRS